MASVSMVVQPAMPPPVMWHQPSDWHCASTVFWAYIWALIGKFRPGPERRSIVTRVDAGTANAAALPAMKAARVIRARRNDFMANSDIPAQSAAGIVV